jgi:hypothetical protein
VNASDGCAANIMAAATTNEVPIFMVWILFLFYLSRCFILFFYLLRVGIAKKSRVCSHSERKENFVRASEESDASNFE